MFTALPTPPGEAVRNCLLQAHARTRGAGRTPKGSQELRPAMRACLATPRTRTRIYHMMHAAASDSASGLDHYLPKDPPERIIWIISKRIPSSRNGENSPQKSFLGMEAFGPVRSAGNVSSNIDIVERANPTLFSSDFRGGMDGLLGTVV